MSSSLCQQYNAEAETWNNWALLTYVPRGDDPNGADPGADATGPDTPAPLFEE